MLDKKGRLFGKISIIDILVIFIILVMAIGAFFAYQKINSKDLLTENKSLLKTNAVDTLEVSLRLDEVRQMTVDGLEVGDEVFMVDTGKFFGTITDVITEPAERLIFDEKGNHAYALVPDHYRVIVKVDVPGNRLNDGYYTADNIKIVHGSELSIKTITVQTGPVIESIILKSGE